MEWVGIFDFGVKQPSDLKANFSFCQWLFWQGRQENKGVDIFPSATDFEMLFNILKKGYFKMMADTVEWVYYMFGVKAAGSFRSIKAVRVIINFFGWWEHQHAVQCKGLMFILFRYGRRVVFLVSVVVPTLSNLIQVFSPSWSFFCCIFFIIGIGQSSKYIAAFVLGTSIFLLICFIT